MPASRAAARRFRHPVALILAAGLGAMVAGCDSSTSETTAINAASEQLIIASGNGAAGVGADVRSRAFSSIVSEMQRVESSSNNPGLKASAAILAARAMIGQGDLASEESRDHRVVALMEIARLRSLAMLRQDMLALGGALSEFDPAKDLTEIDAVSREIAVEAAAIRTRIEELSSRIEAVLGQVGEHLERARVLREQDSTIRLASADFGATQRAEAVKQATTLRREADLLEKRAAELELEAASLEKTQQELQAVAESLDNRAEVLADARVRLEQSARVQIQQANAAEQKAVEFRTEVSEGFAAMRDGALAAMLAAHDEAAGKYSSAASKAGSARSFDATGASLATASAKQSAAMVHRSAASTVALAASLAETIGETEAAAELSARLEEMIASASDAVDQAAGAFQSVRVSRDPLTAETLANLSDSMRRDAMRLRGEPEPVEEPVDDGTTEIEEYIEEAPADEMAPDADPELEPEADPDADPETDPETDPE